ncbi:MAG: HAMP domain-containing histidine kinase [Lachnospiraceae bacterium]|nr:HAMP domain-containing histidine kinase [Lachnospiraceae bacterium]
MSRREAGKGSRITVLIPVLIVAVAAGLVILGMFFYARNRLSKTRYAADSELAGRLETLYPDISQEELAEVIKNRDGNGSQSSDGEAYAAKGAELLDIYGYDAAYVSPGQNKVLIVVLVVGFAVILLSMTAITFVFMKHDKRRTEEIEEITGYVRQLNDKNYDLMLADNSEESLSLLKNEIYKTTVILKEIAENKSEETKRLSRSLEDISHQLRTPLASMNIMIDNICDDPDMPADIRNEFLSDISGQVTWISELVNALLTLAKFDAGTIVMKKEEIDADALISDAVKRLGILLDVRDVHVEYEKPEEKIVFTGDYKWLLEALSNIIKNCAEHSPAGAGLYLSIEQNSIYTKFTVRDEGEGMSGEDQRHIFERFYKAKNARPESVGIGLSLAKSIVEAENGYIKVESEVGKGSTFEIILFFRLK